jgi:hypothetical protein
LQGQFGLLGQLPVLEQLLGQLPFVQVASFLTACFFGVGVGAAKTTLDKSTLAIKPKNIFFILCYLGFYKYCLQQLSSNFRRLPNI